jgi:hypothetical protein
MITKEQADKFAKAEGQVRGAAFKTDAEYVKNHLGEEALQKLKDEMQRLGYPIDYDKVNAMEWYPIGVRALHIEVMKDIFNWDDEQTIKVGNLAPKRSLILKLLMKFLISVEKAVKSAPAIYAKHYTVGKMEINELNNEGQYFIATVKGSQILYDSNAFARHIEGYLTRGIAYVVPGKEVSSSQRKYMKDGMTCVEYKISWR